MKRCCHAILSGSDIFKDSADFPILCFDKKIDKKDRSSLFQKTIYHIWNHAFLQSGQYACDCAEFQGWAEKLSVSGKYGLHRFG